jgi:hypothetical protein
MPAMPSRNASPMVEKFGFRLSRLGTDKFWRPTVDVFQPPL